MTKKSLLKDKSGLSTFLKYSLPVLVFVAVLFFILYGSLLYCNFSSSTEDSVQRLQDIALQRNFKDWTLDKAIKFTNIIGFDNGYSEINKYGGCWGYAYNNLLNVTGFFGRLLMGFLAGFWILIGSKIHKAIKKLGGSNPSSGWLALIANSAWKVLAIGMAYAILMQIPILSVVIKIITLEAIGLNMFLVTFVIAFEIGFGPAWIESYMKFKLRMKAEKAIIAAQMRTRLEKEALKSAQ